MVGERDGVQVMWDGGSACCASGDGMRRERGGGKPARARCDGRGRAVHGRSGAGHSVKQVGVLRRRAWCAGSGVVLAEAALWCCRWWAAASNGGGSCRNIFDTTLEVTATGRRVRGVGGHGGYAGGITRYAALQTTVAGAGRRLDASIDAERCARTLDYRGRHQYTLERRNRGKEKNKRGRKKETVGKKGGKEAWKGKRAKEKRTFPS
ncbi:hypothetical protein B0H13DRAFT_1888348 [Mycena leptocephala]|nr:hypothetical protein B0H13DRAFT_1888348 [Mycena leptocephala]